MPAPIPPLNLNTTATSGADGRQQSGAFTDGAFSVNFNGGSLAGALGAPSWAIAAVVALAGLWLWKRR
jgi:hypothetical protein